MILKIITSHDFRQTLMNQSLKIISGPLLLLIIPLYLTPEQQGYWFTFISLAALAVFADLGFSKILLQFSAHEFAYLSFDSNSLLVGGEYHLKRISTLFIFALKWVLLMALITFPIVLIVGFLVLNSKDDGIIWWVPWIIYGVASALVFLNSMLMSFIEGCNSVGDIQKIRFTSTLTTVGITILLLIIGADLHALAFGLLTGASMGSLMILLRYRSLINQLLRVAAGQSHTWFGDIMPLLWRYLISWTSGYFVYMALTPIIFSAYGSVEAGKVGFTIAAFSALSSMSLVWIQIITPKINMLVSQRNFELLNNLFIKHLILSILSYVAMFFILLISLRHIDILAFLSDNMLDISALAIVGLARFVQTIVNALAVYMRAFKLEPLVWISFFSGLYVCVSAIVMSEYYEFEDFFAVVFLFHIIMLPLVIKQYLNVKKRKVIGY